MPSKGQQTDNSGGAGVEKDFVSSSSSSSSSSDSDDEGGIFQREIEKVSLGGLFTQNQFNLSIGFVVGYDNQSN